MTANRVETELLIFGGRKPGDRDRRLRFYLRGGLRYGDVTGVADLAMLFVGGVTMPPAVVGLCAWTSLNDLGSPPTILTLMRVSTYSFHEYCPFANAPDREPAPRAAGIPEP
jgi:hypothetical protein